MSATELPVFLWKDNGSKFNKEGIFLGIFHGFYLEWVGLTDSYDHYSQLLPHQVARHIFTGPSTAHGGDFCRVHSCNAALHCMDKVEAAHIAYTAILVSLMDTDLTLY
jgi:hypothetical protein